LFHDIAGLKYSQFGFIFAGVIPVAKIQYPPEIDSLGCFVCVAFGGGGGGGFVSGWGGI